MVQSCFAAFAEYFYHDGERLSAVIGDKFVRRIKPDEATKQALSDLLNEDLFNFEIAVLGDDEFVFALAELFQ